MPFDDFTGTVLVPGGSVEYEDWYLVKEEGLVNIVMYTEQEELEELTGLSYDGLWDAGFNMDDWDVGFQCDKELPDGWLSLQLEDYCVGPSHVEYKGKHYYHAHHS